MAKLHEGEDRSDRPRASALAEIAAIAAAGLVIEQKGLTMDNRVIQAFGKAIQMSAETSTAQESAQDDETAKQLGREGGDRVMAMLADYSPEDRDGMLEFADMLTNTARRVTASALMANGNAKHWSEKTIYYGLKAAMSSNDERLDNLVSQLEAIPGLYKTATSRKAS